MNKVVNLPFIKPNKIHLCSNISNKIKEINTNIMNKINFSNGINNITLNKRKTKSIEIYKPIRNRLRKSLNNLDDLNGFYSFNSYNSPRNSIRFNSFDIPKNKNTNKYNYLYNSNNFCPNIDIPLSKHILVSSNRNKRIINNISNYKEKSKISKLSYDDNNAKNYEKLKKGKSLNKIGQQSLINVFKKLNNLESQNYCFYSYSYNVYDNIPNRKYMEDCLCIKKNLLLNINNGIIFSYFAIFDGHGGREVSLFLSQNFYNVLFNQFKNIDNFEDNENNLNKIASLIKFSFLFIDKRIINDPSLKDIVGSTATVVFLFKLGTKDNFSKYLICANIGDSKGYILSDKKILQITTDHNCYNENEVSRIIDSGGTVVNNRVKGSLMLTRSFGDKDMKKYGVICEPYFFCKKIKEYDRFIIIASDGLWDVISESDISEFVNIYENKILSSEEFSQKIVELAIQKGTKDNVSCIVIKLNK